MNCVRHGSSGTFETKSSYCRAKVEYNSINLVRHGSGVTFEMGLISRMLPRMPMLIFRAWATCACFENISSPKIKKTVFVQCLNNYRLSLQLAEA